VRDAIAAGADSVEALGVVTKAGTGCGSCKSELAQLLPRPSHGAVAPALAS
jgi:NAD(P)H-nitrite reductase large subunit